jgi:Ricin-type beta-trefoil lectin domain
MKKLIANLFLAIIITTGLSAFALANTVSNVRSKSAINTAGSGKCMDVASGQTSAGTPIVQFSCHNGYNQVFSVEQITFGGQHIIKTNLNPNMCVGITDNVFANAGERLSLVPCRVAGDVPLGARWYLENINGKTRFRAISPSQDRQSTCLDVPSGLASDSLWLQLYYCHTGGNQQWSLF